MLIFMNLASDALSDANLAIIGRSLGISNEDALMSIIKQLSALIKEEEPEEEPEEPKEIVYPPYKPKAHDNFDGMTETTIVKLDSMRRQSEQTLKTLADP